MLLLSTATNFVNFLPIIISIAALVVSIVALILNRRQFNKTLRA